jgi:nucleoside 2-deoxyribosyltransferase
MSSRKLKVYLAGDIANSDWRLDVMRECQDLPITFLNPMTGVDYTPYGLRAASYHRPGYSFTDLFKVNQADIVFVYLRPDSGSRFSGTSAEVGYALAKGKHTVICNALSTEEASYYGFIQDCASRVFYTLWGAMNYLRAIATQVGFDITKEDK